MTSRDAEYPACSPRTYLSSGASRWRCVVLGSSLLSSVFHSPDLLLFILDLREPSLIFLMLLNLLLFQGFGVFRGQCAKVVLILLFLCLSLVVPLRPKVKRVLEVKSIGLKTVLKVLYPFLVILKSGLTLPYSGVIGDLSFRVCFAIVGLLIRLLLVSP